MQWNHAWWYYYRTSFVLIFQFILICFLFLSSDYIFKSKWLLVEYYFNFIEIVDCYILPKKKKINIVDFFRYKKMLSLQFKKNEVEKSSLLFMFVPQPLFSGCLLPIQQNDCHQESVPKKKKNQWLVLAWFIQIASSNLVGHASFKLREQWGTSFSRTLRETIFVYLIHLFWKVLTITSLWQQVFFFFANYFSLTTRVT